jgi:hypothetical protein
MVRCRGCGQLLAESDEDFELTGHVLVEMSPTTCARCGSVLEPGVRECPTCALMMQLEAPPLERPRRHNAPMESRPARRPTADVSHAAEYAMAAAMLSPNPLAGAHSPAAPEPLKFHGRTETEGSVTRDDAAGNPTETKPRSAPRVQSPEKGAACIALITSLHTTSNRKLRCEIATALGALGDRQAVVPLERFMTDPDVQVRRAVAAALVQLGHPKGKSLLAIAEKKPAVSREKSRTSSSGAGTDRRTMLTIGGALAVALVAGGFWMWTSSGPVEAPPKKGAKKAVTKAKKKPKPAKRSAEES